MEERTPFANVLHAEIVEKLASGRVLARGKTYAKNGKVKSVARRGGRIVGVVLGGASYEVIFWAKGDGLGYVCTCPAGAEGDFCKHCVAVALVWLGRS
jgi:uncharacterized Zn finger protein